MEYNLDDKMNWGKYKGRTIKVIIDYFQDAQYLNFLHNSKYRFKKSKQVIQYIKNGQIIKV